MDDVAGQVVAQALDAAAAPAPTQSPPVGGSSVGSSHALSADRVGGASSPADSRGLPTDPGPVTARL